MCRADRLSDRSLGPLVENSWARLIGKICEPAHACVVHGLLINLRH